MKKLLWLLPLIGIFSFQFLSGEPITVAGLNLIFKALVQFGPSLTLNTLLIGMAIIIILLCGMRIYGFIFSLFKKAVFLDCSAGLLIYFIIGSLFTFVVMMTAGVLGVYFQAVIWGLALLVIFFPYRLKEFFNDLKAFAQDFKLGFRRARTSLDFHLFGSALVFFGIPLLLLQLTSMVPPWMDILEVYVAPVQRIISFGQYIPHDALPFALYNSSRSVPLFTSFYSFCAALTGLQAAQAIVASSVYILLFSLITVYFAANSLGGSPFGGIAVWLFSLSVNFFSVAHGRSGVFVMLFFIPAVAFFMRIITAETEKDKLFYAILTGVTLGATALVHPLIGVYSLILVSFVSIMIMIWVSPRFLYWFSYIFIITGFIAAGLLFQVRELIHLSLPLTFLAWGGLGVLSGLAIYFTKSLSQKYPGAGLSAKPLQKAWIPVGAILLALAISAVFSWRFHWMNETPLNFLFNRLPFFILIGFLAIARLIYVYIKNKTLTDLRLKVGTILLFIAGGFLLLALPLYILPLFNLDNSVGASLCQELPSKGMNYWLNPLLVVMGPLCIYGFKKRLWKDALTLLLLGIIVAPIFSVLPKFNFYDDARINVSTVAKQHLNVAANGYFIGYGDDRKVMSDDDYTLVTYLLGLIRSGKIKISDTVYHIAEEQHPWTASPFPAFSGVRQSLVLVKRDPGDFNTKWGRLTDFPEDFKLDAPEKWVVAEKSVIEKYPEFFDRFRQKYHTVFENNRLIMFERIER